MMKHGGNIAEAAARYGFQASEMIDLSTGISPWSYPLDMENITPQSLRDLPQAEDEARLIEQMRLCWSVPDSAAIALAPGSGLLINLAARLRAQGTVALPDPVYSEHDAAWRGEGHDIVIYPAGGLPDSNLVVAVQPGNPMGQCLAPEDWQEVLDRVAADGGLLVMDEAFIDLVPTQSLMPCAGQKGLIILRSLGKFYGLAGVRLGAAIGHPDDIDRLKSLMGPWAVSTLALNLATQALADAAWADDQRNRLKAQMTTLKEMLITSGLTLIGGTDLYALVDVAGDAAVLQDKLARHGIWTRVFDHRPNWMRFGLPADNAAFARLKAALAD
ncbi:MAG: threonine-phosphate decarboxylase [Alphaproteobacteria bacterium]|nr:threonine-phosphate decarboxylase [Alphaproteobacteria bacterium]